MCNTSVMPIKLITLNELFVDKIKFLEKNIDQIYRKLSNDLYHF